MIHGWAGMSAGKELLSSSHIVPRSTDQERLLFCVMSTDTSPTWKYKDSEARAQFIRVRKHACICMYAHAYTTHSFSDRPQGDRAKMANELVFKEAAIQPPHHAYWGRPG